MGWFRTFHGRASGLSPCQGRGCVTHSHLPSVTRLSGFLSWGGGSTSSGQVKSANVQGEEIWLPSGCMAPRAVTDGEVLPFWAPGPTPGPEQAHLSSNTPKTLGKRRPKVVWEAENKKQKERRQNCDEKGFCFCLSHRKPPWPESLLYPEYAWTQTSDTEALFQVGVLWAEDCCLPKKGEIC